MDVLDIFCRKANNRGHLNELAGAKILRAVDTTTTYQTGIHIQRNVLADIGHREKVLVRIEKMVL
jgi:hypothetical protein